MIRLNNRAVSLSLLLLALILSSRVNSQEACVVNGDTLTNARDNYTAQCTAARVDCDPFNGQWYCASFNMTSPIPPALTVPSPASNPGPSQPGTSQPVTPAPVPQGSTVPGLAPQITAPVIRPSCARADSDPDGDGYGWENAATCLVDNSSIAATLSAPTATVQQTITASTQPASDSTSNQSPDNQLNSNSDFSAADITDLILVTGQSNALGAGTAFNAALDAPNQRVFAFTDNGWQEANLNQVWDLNWHPRNHPETDPSNNFSLHFGKSVASRDSSRVVGFILATAPGQKIEYFAAGGDFYNTMQRKVLDAINQLPHKSALDGILWHQGESDGVDEQYYTDALYALIFNLRNEAWTIPQTPFICGETKIESVNYRLNGLNRDTDANTACVRAIDLSTLGDNRHFDAPALRTLGARYADAYLNITR